MPSHESVLPEKLGYWSESLAGASHVDRSNDARCILDPFDIDISSNINDKYSITCDTGNSCYLVVLERK